MLIFCFEQAYYLTTVIVYGPSNGSLTLKSDSSDVTDYFHAMCSIRYLTPLT